MANTVLSLIGPDLAIADIVVNAGPAPIPSANPSADNTQATLRRSYAVQFDTATSSIVIDTGLPPQSAPGSYALSLVPNAAGAGALVYTRSVLASYSPTDGKLTLTAGAGANADLFVTVDLAHTLSR